MTTADLAGWIALVATTIAAVMTAANLGARITGFGFIVFTVGSLSWVTVALGKGDQPQLLYSNIFLTGVNLIGIWRWLGRQARYDEGGAVAARRSAAAQAPTLFAGGALIGAPLTGQGDAKLGQVVEAMMRCDGAALAYLVVSEGGVGGVGERLHALAPEGLRFGHDGVTCGLTAAALAALPVLEKEGWPASA
ncbi:PRC-barrel domain containing protein [Sphingomonas sp.]|uniref:PRC-barrel domain containing protein n=1 Tax=Sphingomonas sp. TaxID=28214 RepID=UPI003CC65733